MGLVHAFVSAKPPAPDPTIVDGPKWNDTHRFTGANIGALLYRDAADLIQGLGSATGVLRCTAPGAVPFWDPTIDTTELGYLDGVTPGVVTASKAVVVDANKDIASFRNLTIEQLGVLAWSPDVKLLRESAGVLGLRNGNAQQAFYVFNKYTDATNNERGVLQWSADTFYIGTVNAGTGTARDIVFVTAAGAQRWKIGATTGHFLAGSDNVYDIGASGATRPRNIFYGTALVCGNLAANSGGLRLPNNIGVGWRNAANSTDYWFYLTAADQFMIQAPLLPSSSNILDLGATANQFRSVYAGTAIIVGGNTAGTGAIRLPNNNAIYWRNAANTTEYGFTLDPTNILRSTAPMAIVNGAIPQSLAIYRTHTDISNNERLDIGADMGGIGTGSFAMVTRAVGTGVGQPLYLGTMANAILGFIVNSVTRWVITTSNIIPNVDNSYDLGSATFRVRNAYLGGTLDVPAATLSGPAAGLSLYNVGPANYERLFIGWSGNAAYVMNQQSGTGTPRSMYIGTTSAAATLDLMTNSTGRWRLTGDGMWLPTGDNLYDMGAVSPNRVRNIFAAGSLVLGTNPAAGGAIRIPNAQYIYGRNAANTADRLIVGIASTDDTLIGSGSGLKVLPGSSAMHLGDSVSYWQSISVGGANCAAAGSVRLPQSGYIAARNAANTADVVLLSKDASNNAVLGDSSAANVLVASTGNRMMFGGTTNAFPSLQRSGVNLQLLFADASNYTNLLLGRVMLNAVTPLISGAGTPEGAVTAPVGSLYLRTDGGAGTTLYIKETGATATGWVAK